MDRLTTFAKITICARVMLFTYVISLACAIYIICCFLLSRGCKMIPFSCCCHFHEQAGDICLFHVYYIHICCGIYLNLGHKMQKARARKRQRQKHRQCNSNVPSVGANRCCIKDAAAYIHTYTYTSVQISLH